ncbi:MAG: tRNA modification GTPase [Phycisphaerales bacterium]|nr:tRNA modification GTPase [Phycisphaerales bacterium]
MYEHDTIAAISSPVGSARRSIVRLSGPDSWRIAGSQVTPVKTSHARRWLSTTLLHPPVSAGLILFKSPHSFTGEDSAELHLPGGTTLAQMVLEAVLAAGARQAEPGEFSARAFLHGKCDLTKAEGIAATIGAENERQLRAAAALRDGALHRWCQTLCDQLGNMLAMVEAGIDFSDEPDVSFISPAELQRQVTAITADIARAQTHAVQWETLDTLPAVVLLGRPNVGKSSLLNALAGHDRAIVSPIAGTTRDAVSTVIQTPVGQVRLVDAAGVEESPTALATLMNEARHTAMARADCVVVVTDGTENQPTLDLLANTAAVSGMATLWVRNKCDQPADDAGTASASAPHACLHTSALAQLGLDELRVAIGQAITNASGAEATLTLNRRHRQWLAAATSALHSAQQMLAANPESAMRYPELIASDLRLALDAVGNISGLVSPDEVLGKIFSSFCIGK